MSLNPLQTLFWYGEMVFSYLWEMIPCMTAAVVLYLAVLPVRKARLQALGLHSSGVREVALLVFLMFSAGLAALTLFPADFWGYIMDWLTNPLVRLEGFDLHGFYPGLAAAFEETDYRNLFTPFQEILRGLRGGPWVFFMLLGNIGMFLPIGFFPALLWHRPRWWKTVLMGFAASFTIEFVQFFIGRSTDVDDLILNTTGALLGYLLSRLFVHLTPDWAELFHCQEGKDVLHGLFE